MIALTKLALAASVAIASATAANAQYYQAINQVTNMLQTAFSGGFNYRGFVDAGYVNGIGDKQASFLEFSTTQGVKYGNIFFMGIGMGVDVMFTDYNGGTGNWLPSNEKSTQTAVAIPMFTDFRLNFGQPTSTGFFIDLKVGAAFYVSDNYIRVGDGYINSSSSFYLKPTIGVRVPVSKSNPKLAMNFGASYQLLTNSYWYNPNHNNNITLSSLGLTVGFEW